MCQCYGALPAESRGRPCSGYANFKLKPALMLRSESAARILGVLASGLRPPATWGSLTYYPHWHMLTVSCPAGHQVSLRTTECRKADAAPLPHGNSDAQAISALLLSRCLDWAIAISHSAARTGPASHCVLFLERPITMTITWLRKFTSSPVCVPPYSGVIN